SAVSALKWSSAGKVVTQTVSWAVTLLVIRLLSPADYGLMAMSAVIITIMASVAELGLGASVVQARTLDREELANVTGAVVGLNLACGVLVVLIAPLAAAVFGEWRLTAVIRVSAMQFLFYAVATVPQSLAQRDMKFKWLAIIDVWSSLLT